MLQTWDKTEYTMYISYIVTCVKMNMICQPPIRLHPEFVKYQNYITLDNINTKYENEKFLHKYYSFPVENLIGDFKH